MSRTDHLVPLGETGWRLWRDVALRSAGFSTAMVRALADPPLADAADGVLSGATASADYESVYTDATARLSAVIRRIAGDPRFREAVTWQNRGLVVNCLDKAAAGERRNVRGRNHEMAIVGHVQRYALKNDTIGFFGPVGWASWADGPEPLTVTVGDQLLSRREVYFEAWAIDEVARALGADPELRPWLAPRRDPGVVLRGKLAHRPEELPLPLTEAEAALLKACDGVRTARDLARDVVVAGSHPFPSHEEVLTALAGFREQKLLLPDLEGPVEAWPEATLRKKLEAVGDPVARERAVALVDRLLDARAEVTAASGDADRLGTAMDRLNAVFHEVTGQEATRRHGRIYAGRTLVYEDTVRDAHAELGTSLRETIAPPLGLALDSARWLLNRIAAEYHALFLGMHQRWTERNASEAMPLARLLGAATPHLHFSLRQLPRPVRSAVAEFQERWRRVLGEPTDPSRHDLVGAELRERVRAEFPAEPPAWATAIHHSPDLMIAAESEQAVRDGDYLVVLGELHASFNSLESRLFVEQHPDPGLLRAADAADHGDGRVYLVPAKDALPVTSRLSPPSAMVAPSATYCASRRPSVETPGEVLPLADLFVHREDGGLVVRDRAGTFHARLLEMLSEPLSHISVNGFKPLESSAHRPRVTIDRLVLAREAWSFPAGAIEWAARRKEPERYLGARAWRAEQDLPERAFYTCPTEDKPAFVDFTSLALVNMFAKAVRQAAEQDPGATIGLTEMLPDTDQTWLTDDRGEKYTAELRTIAVDPLGARR